MINLVWVPAETVGIESTVLEVYNICKKYFTVILNEKDQCFIIFDSKDTFRLPYQPQLPYIYGHID